LAPGKEEEEAVKEDEEEEEGEEGEETRGWMRCPTTWPQTPSCYTHPGETPA
jgi:hypothetical protein